jgi:hypothetical protein
MSFWRWPRLRRTAWPDDREPFSLLFARYLFLFMLPQPGEQTCSLARLLIQHLIALNQQAIPL